MQKSRVVSQRVPTVLENAIGDSGAAGEAAKERPQEGQNAASSATGVRQCWQIMIASAN